ncbi:serine/threonine protein kinase [Sphaerisporangium album]|uniref:non-specific serine/threonine protein kinase n=1 Tax=Sphaerisporangium album TaxID=509200 RepID=A0A367FRH1_9ACTN|nr:serine/threonine-protein kinase [Sphaerisporangium album]RCG32993.1 serine/threonine protein kinase [Sphaerisporangium album]
MTAETRRRVAGRYRLLEPIGQGGMGVVWRAHDELLDRPVAVKEVLHHAVSEQERAAFNMRTIREARAAGRLDHPSVVVVHDVIEEDGRPWIVMQLVRSRSLGQVLREEGPQPPRRVAEIGVQVLGALRAAHAAGVLHRDVKPENVLLTDAGRVVLTDFGIATMPMETALTTTGGLTGTPAFLPPERLRGLPAVPESDLWSLGATLYAAVEGRPPFDRGAPVPTMAAVLHDEPEPARHAGPLAPVLDGLLRKDPARRMSAADTAEALGRVAAGEAPRGGRQARRRAEPAGAPAATSPEMPIPWSTSPSAPVPKPRRRPGLAGVLVAVPLTLVVVAAGWYGFARLVDGATPDPPNAPTLTASAGVPTGPEPPTAEPSATSAEPSAASPSPTRTGVPRGWRTQPDRLGFTIALPPGWKEVDREPARVWYRPPGSGSYLLVDLTRWADGDPLTALRTVERQSLAEGRLPGYRLVWLRSLTYKGRPAADWEFTWQMDSGRAHVRDRAFTSADGRHFAIYLHTPDGQWAAQSAYFDTFARSFRPT